MIFYTLEAPRHIPRSFVAQRNIPATNPQVRSLGRPIRVPCVSSTLSVHCTFSSAPLRFFTHAKQQAPVRIYDFLLREEDVVTRLRTIEAAVHRVTIIFSTLKSEGQT